MKIPHEPKTWITESEAAQIQEETGCYFVFIQTHGAPPGQGILKVRQTRPYEGALESPRIRSDRSRVEVSVHEWFTLLAWNGLGCYYYTNGPKALLHSGYLPGTYRVLTRFGAMRPRYRKRQPRPRTARLARARR